MKKKNNAMMKAMRLILPLACSIAAVAWAEDYYRIYTDAGVHQENGSRIDSVKIEGDAIKFYNAETPVYSRTLAGVDSITFATESFPALPLSAPANGASINTYLDAPTFSWTQVAGVTGYALKFSTSSQFPATETVSIDAGNVAQYTLSADEYNTLKGVLTALDATSATVYWTVTPAVNTEGAISETRSFTAVGGEAAFPYQMTDATNTAGWTISCTVDNQPDRIPENLLLDNSDWWQSAATLGNIQGTQGKIITFIIDMLDVRTVSRVVGETNSTNRVGTTNVYVGPASGGPWTSIGQLEFTTSAPYTKEIQLDIPVETRYLRLYITKTADNNGSMYNSNTLLFNRVYVYGSNLSAQ